jgi:hypothetical protein
MKKAVLYTALGAFVLCCSSAPARANQVEFLISASALIADNPTFGGNCASGLTNCGVLGLGLVSATTTGGVALPSFTVTFVAPSLGTTDGWTSFSGFTGSGETALAGSGMEESGSTIAFITATTNIGTGGAKYTDQGGTTGISPQTTGGAAGAGLSSTGTIQGSDTFGFILNFGSTTVTPTTETLNLVLAADEINPSTGAQVGTKEIDGTLSVNLAGVNYTPEPSTIVLVLGGIAAIVIGRFRRVRA